MRKRTYARVDSAAKAALKKKVALAAAIPLALYLLASFLFGEMGLVKYYRMKHQQQTLVQEIAELKNDNVRLLREVHALRNDAAYIEKLARDNLGLARPGEIIYYYGDASAK